MTSFSRTSLEVPNALERYIFSEMYRVYSSKKIKNEVFDLCSMAHNFQAVARFFIVQQPDYQSRLTVPKLSELMKFLLDVTKNCIYQT